MTTINPNPGRITDAMWKLWTNRPNSAWKLSGFFAEKKGYHNTVTANLKLWPGTYSIKLPLDLVKINRDKSRAIDLTMTDSEMVKWTTRMKNSALNPADHRLAAVREFYGTLDNKTVYGLIKDNEDGPWKRSSADATHLWHGHMSVFTAFVNNWSKLSPILSVWAGTSLTESVVQDMFIKEGDSGEEVRYWQYVHNAVRETVTPPAPIIKVDGDYGPATVSAFKDFVHKQGGQATYTGESLVAWLAIRYHGAFAKVSAPQSDTSINEEQLTELVNTWLESHIPNDLTITANLNGKVTI